MCYDYWPYGPPGPILLSSADAPAINDLFIGFVWIVLTYCAASTLVIAYTLWRGR